MLEPRVAEHIERDLSVFLLAGPPDVGVAQLRFREYLLTGEPTCLPGGALRGAGPRAARATAGHLMEAAFAAARERGATTMELGTATSDRAARGLYESLGFTNLEKPGDPARRCSTTSASSEARSRSHSAERGPPQRIRQPMSADPARRDRRTRPAPPRARRRAPAGPAGSASARRCPRPRRRGAAGLGVEPAQPTSCSRGARRGRRAEVQQRGVALLVTAFLGPLNRRRRGRQRRARLAPGGLERPAADRAASPARGLAALKRLRWQRVQRMASTIVPFVVVPSLSESKLWVSLQPLELIAQ